MQCREEKVRIVWKKNNNSNILWVGDSKGRNINGSENHKIEEKKWPHDRSKVEMVYHRQDKKSNFKKIVN